MNSKKNGFIVPAAVLIIVLITILVPLMVKLSQHESKSTQKTLKSTKSFQLAEAGQDRGIWKLKESASVWTSVTSGTSPITGYNNDVEYTDDDSDGKYKILITTGTTSNTVVVISKGKANGQDEIRAIKAVYSKSSLLGALSIDGGLKYKPNLIVHWGPVVTYTSIDEEPNQYYPRKYSAGQIKGRDEVNNSDNGALPSGNWSAVDYAAFQNLGTEPTVNLSYYLAKASASCVPQLRGSGNGAASHLMIGGCHSGVYNESVRFEPPNEAGFPSTYYYDSSTSVIYINGNMSSYKTSTFIRAEAIIIMGNADFNGRGKASHIVDVPPNAQLEYQKSTEATTFWASSGWTAGSATTLSDIGFHGFLYVSGNFVTGGGGSNMVGAIFIGGNSTNVNTFTLYYDDDVAQNVALSDANITRTSWDEITTTW